MLLEENLSVIRTTTVSIWLDTKIYFTLYFNYKWKKNSNLLKFYNLYEPTLTVSKTATFNKHMQRDILFRQI